MLLAWAMGVVAVVPGRAAAEPVAVAEGALRVEVAAEVENAERLPGWIGERNPELARRVAEGPGRERWVAVEIEGKYLDYRVRVVAMRDGEAVGGEGEWVACQCGEDDLLVRVDQEIAAAVERLREPVTTEVGETPAAPGEHPPAPSAEASYRKRTGLGLAGIAVGAVGLGGVVVGGAFLGVGERVPADYQHLVRDYRPPGVVLLATGGALLGAGVAMLVTDLVQCRREHRRCRVEGDGASSSRARQRRALVLGPWLEGQGVAIAGRF